MRAVPVVSLLTSESGAGCFSVDRQSGAGCSSVETETGAGCFSVDM